jgi:hypothetical protein
MLKIQDYVEQKGYEDITVLFLYTEPLLKYAPNMEGFLPEICRETSIQCHGNQETFAQRPLAHSNFQMLGFTSNKDDRRK